MSGGEAKANWARLGAVFPIFSRKRLRLCAGIRAAIDVAYGARFEAVRRREFGCNCIELDNVVARDCSGMQ
jgi:hypothetical protein